MGGWQRLRKKRQRPTPDPFKDAVGRLSDPARAAFARLLDQAENDPEALRAEARRLAEKYGAAAEVIYKKVQENPAAARRAFGNALLQTIVRAVRG